MWLQIMGAQIRRAYTMDILSIVGFPQWQPPWNHRPTGTEGLLYFGLVCLSPSLQQGHCHLLLCS
jgi:hypothetical protein